MNDSERRLIRFVCDGDMRNAQKAVKIILDSISSKKDEQFKENMFRKLESKREFIELPYNLQYLLIAEDTEEFPETRFLLRNEEKSITQKIVAIYRASEKLNEMGIPYLPALMLYGQSGCGKTMLARYIAHKAKLPFLRIQFSSLVDSHLGQTQSNLARIFDYVRTAPCVLCFDEIDAVGMARGQKDDVGEMNRVVIAIMQEMDRLPNNVIIVGTTNRFDRLDPALIRRFPLQYELKPLCRADAEILSKRFFEYAGAQYENIAYEEHVPASTVIKECTERIVNQVLNQEDFLED